MDKRFDKRHKRRSNPQSLIVIILITVILISSSITMASWMRSRGDDGNRAQYSGGTSDDYWTYIWESEFHEYANSEPTYCQAPVTSGLSLSEGGYLVYNFIHKPDNIIEGDIIFCFNWGSWTLVWEITLPANIQVTSPPILYDPGGENILIVVSDHSKYDPDHPDWTVQPSTIFFLDAATGMRMHFIKLKDDYYRHRSPIVVDDHLYVFDNGGTLNVRGEAEVYKISLTGANQFDCVYPNGTPWSLSSIFSKGVRARWASWTAATINEVKYLILPLHFVDDDAIGLLIMDTTNQMHVNSYFDLFKLQCGDKDNNVNWPVSSVLANDDSKLFVATWRNLYEIDLISLIPTLGIVDNPDDYSEQITLPVNDIKAPMAMNANDELFIVGKMVRTTKHGMDKEITYLIRLSEGQLNAVFKYDIDVFDLEQSVHTSGPIVTANSVIIGGDDGLYVMDFDFTDKRRKATLAPCPSAPCVGMGGVVIIFDENYDVYYLH